MPVVITMAMHFVEVTFSAKHDAGSRYHYSCLNPGAAPRRSAIARSQVPPHVALSWRRQFSPSCLPAMPHTYQQCIFDGTMRIQVIERCSTEGGELAHRLHMPALVEVRLFGWGAHLWAGGPFGELEPAVAFAVLVDVRLPTCLVRAETEGVAWQRFVATCAGPQGFRAFGRHSKGLSLHTWLEFSKI